MKNKYIFVLVMLVALTLGGMGFTGVYTAIEEEKEEAAGEITVVTSFYPVYIAAMNITDGMDNITLENLSEPQTGCLHDYQLTPADMKLLSTADVFIVNGGGIESFLSDVAAQYQGLTIINASAEVPLLEDNAHAWMSVPDYMIQVQTIADELSEKDESHAAEYQANAEAYLEKLKPLEEEQNEIKPYTEGKQVIIFHEAYEYVAEDFGMEVAYIMDLDEERQVSAGEVADVMGAIDENGISVIFAEELYGKSMGDTVEKETTAKVFYLDSLVRGDYEKDSYLVAMERNIQLVKEAFAL